MRKQKTIRKYSSTKVTVRWYDIPGQTGYQISRSTKVSGRSVYATVKSTSAASKTIKTTKGKTYYYRVRAYKKVGDTYKLSKANITYRIDAIEDVVKSF